MATPPELHLTATSGRAFNLLGLPTVIKISAEESGGLYSFYEQSVPQGMGVPPHIHSAEDELFMVMEGEVTFLLGDTTVVARKGDIVRAPRNAPHAYTGHSSEPALLRVMALPGAGMEAMFDELAGFPSNMPPDPVKLMEVCLRYGITFLPPV